MNICIISISLAFLSAIQARSYEEMQLHQYSKSSKNENFGPSNSVIQENVGNGSSKINETINLKSDKRPEEITWSSTITKDFTNDKQDGRDIQVTEGRSVGGLTTTSMTATRKSRTDTTGSTPGRATNDPTEATTKPQDLEHEHEAADGASKSIRSLKTTNNRKTTTAQTTSKGDRKVATSSKPATKNLAAYHTRSTDVAKLESSSALPSTTSSPATSNSKWIAVFCGAIGTFGLVTLVYAITQMF